MKGGHVIMPYVIYLSPFLHSTMKKARTCET